MANQNGDDGDELVYDATDQTDAVSLGGETIDTQIATAKKYPRSVDKCVKEAKTLATRNQETAQSCFYTLPRSGDSIRGPSIRLAEIISISWGNLRIDSRIIEENQRSVTAEGMGFDLEKNVAVREQTTENIVRSDGTRYSQDMINMTKKAAMSKVERNVIFAIVPKPYWQEIYKEAMKASTGDGTIEERRQNMFSFFNDEYGADKSQIFRILDVNGEEDIGEEELIDLQGLHNAIDEGVTTFQDVLRRIEGSSERTDEMNDFIHGNGSFIPEEDDDSDDGSDAQSEDQQSAESESSSEVSDSGETTTESEDDAEHLQLSEPTRFDELDSVTADDVPKPSEATVDAAMEHGVDLSQWAGTGKNGRVVKSDVSTIADMTSDDEPDQSDADAAIAVTNKMSDVKQLMDRLDLSDNFTSTMTENFDIDKVTASTLDVEMLQQVEEHLLDIEDGIAELELGSEGEVVIPE